MLKNSDIDRIQKYYRKNIISNDTWQGMQKDMETTWNHLTSTDQNPKHQDCGEWCFWIQYSKLKKKEIKEYSDKKAAWEKENKEDKKQEKGKKNHLTFLKNRKISLHMHQK